MKKKLAVQGLIKFFSGLVIVALLVFLPAGTLSFPRGWLFMGVLFVPMLAAGLFMLAKAPALLEKRLNARENESEQRSVIAMSGLMFMAGFIAAGLDFCFGWTHMPMWLTVLACVIFLLSYAMFGEVLRENEYLSRTVEVQQGQKVIDTGLYGVVRHPMYFATTLMFLAMPLILGSLPSFIIFLIYPFLLVKRIKNEEEVLESGLDGYSDYKKKVKYRLLPFIW